MADVDVTGGNVELTLLANDDIQLTISGGSIDLELSSSIQYIASNLDSLSDVTITTPANGQVLTYNGTIWVNQAAVGQGQ